jgi:hypothetical protein
MVFLGWALLDGGRGQSLSSNFVAKGERFVLSWVLRFWEFCCPEMDESVRFETGNEEWKASATATADSLRE